MIYTVFVSWQKTCQNLLDENQFCIFWKLVRIIIYGIVQTQTTLWPANGFLCKSLLKAKDKRLKMVFKFLFFLSFRTSNSSHHCGSPIHEADNKSYWASWLFFYLLAPFICLCLWDISLEPQGPLWAQCENHCVKI